jgi:SAM-dependent methyltransferase
MDGTPQLGGDRPQPDLQSDRQRRFYEEECDPEFEITRPHSAGRFYEALIDRKLRSALSLLDFDVRGLSLLEVCCGSGMISEALSSRGARVTAFDFSSAAIRRARERQRRYGFQARWLVADAQTPPFAERSFDVVAVHDGLHHLQNPYQSIEAMARIARMAVMVLEPAEAALTRLAVRLGIAEDVEDAGNEVRRLVPDRVASALRAQGFSRVAWNRTLMYYPHQPGRWFRALGWGPMLPLSCGAFEGLNLVAGRFGNKLAVVGMRAPRV